MDRCFPNIKTDFILNGRDTNAEKNIPGAYLAEVTGLKDPSRGTLPLCVRWNNNVEESEESANIKKKNVPAAYKEDEQENLLHPWPN